MSNYGIIAKDSSHIEKLHPISKALNSECINMLNIKAALNINYL